MTDSRRQTADDRQTTGTSGQQAGGAVTLTVPSHPKFLYVVRSTLYPLALDAGFSKRESQRIVLAVDEACSNIIRHAYSGDTTKTITLTVEDGAECFAVRIRDYGRKVDRAAIAPRDLADIRPGGLGTHFIKAAFETVNYDHSPEQGTLLILEKKKQQVST